MEIENGKWKMKNGKIEWREWEKQKQANARTFVRKRKDSPFLSHPSVSLSLSLSRQLGFWLHWRSSHLGRTQIVNFEVLLVDISILLLTPFSFYTINFVSQEKKIDVSISLDSANAVALIRSPYLS